MNPHQGRGGWEERLVIIGGSLHLTTSTANDPGSRYNKQRNHTGAQVEDTLYRAGHSTSTACKLNPKASRRRSIRDERRASWFNAAPRTISTRAHTTVIENHHEKPTGASVPSTCA